MSSVMKKAALPAAVTALVAALIIGTPEPITLIVLCLAGFVSAMVVLVAFSRLTPVASWTKWKQRTAIWLIAAAGAAAGCFLMISPVFRR